MPNTISLHRVLSAPPERVYRAFTDPHAMVKWFPPNGFTATIHQIDVRVGGGYKMSFTSFSTGSSHSFSGKYIELIPNQKIKYIDKFDDPKLAGNMQVTITLEEKMCGTDLKIIQEDIPDLIPVEMCYLGWQQSLNLLAQLVEAEIKD